MTNLIAFPGRRRAQPQPMVNDLAALELELVRARLSQIRSETRYANTLWVSYCFRKTVFWAAVLWMLSVLFK